MRLSLLVLCFIAGLSPFNVKAGDLIAPTRTATTLMRGGPGAFGAARAGSKHHDAVDIVANQTSPDRNVYRVMAVRSGTIAYARMNGSATTGYGYTIIIDHGDGTYALYAHLAPIASSGLALGKLTNQGDVIGYMADPAAHEMSSGNVAACVVAPYDKIQLHFELFNAPKGRSSTDTIAPIKIGSTSIDPTPTLRTLGYSAYPPPTDADKKQIENQCSAGLPADS